MQLLDTAHHHKGQWHAQRYLERSQRLARHARRLVAVQNRGAHLAMRRTPRVRIPGVSQQQGEGGPFESAWSPEPLRGQTPRQPPARRLPRAPPTTCHCRLSSQASGVRERSAASPARSRYCCTRIHSRSDVRVPRRVACARPARRAPCRQWGWGSNTGQG